MDAVTLGQQSDKGQHLAIVRHPPPDPKATLPWRTNPPPPPRPDRKKMNARGSLEQRLSQMTPEERARDAFEFAEQVRARLAELRGTTIEHEPKQ